MNTTAIATVTDNEQQIRLQVIEGRIESNLRSLKSLWTSILEDIAIIQSEELWKLTHDSFNEYWEDRFSRSGIQQMFDAGDRTYQWRLEQGLKASIDVLPIGNEYTPQNEAQARPLAQLESVGERQEAAKLAHDLSGGEPKTKDFEKGAKAVQAPRHGYKVGDRAWICNPKSDRLGQQVEIICINAGKNGTLVSGRFDDGRVAVFVPQEGIDLTSTDPKSHSPKPKPAPTPAPKTTPQQELSARLTIAEALNQEYRDRMVALLKAIENVDMDEVERLWRENREWMGIKN